MQKAWAVKVHAFYEKSDIYDCADVGKRKELSVTKKDYVTKIIECCRKREEVLLNDECHA